MKRYDKNAKYRIVCYAVTAIAVLVGWFLRGPAASALIPMLSVFVPHEQVTTMANTCRANGTTLYLVVVLMVLVWLIIWAVQHQLFKRGLRYALVHARMVHELQKGLLETPGYSVELNNQEAKLPAIKIEFSRNMINGLIKIQNHIKYNTLLEKVNLSPAIGRYVVEQQYLTDDENWYVFEITDGLIDWRLIFDNYSHFQTYCKRQEDYTIFIDKRTSLPLCSMLLVGETGSGKTYTLYSMILQFLNWRMVPELYFVDPKDSSLAVISDRIAPDRSAADIEEIIALQQAIAKHIIDKYCFYNMEKDEPTTFSEDLAAIAAGAQVDALSRPNARDNSLQQSITYLITNSGLFSTFYKVYVIWGDAGEKELLEHLEASYEKYKNEEAPDKPDIQNWLWKHYTTLYNTNLEDSF